MKQPKKKPSSFQLSYGRVASYRPSDKLIFWILALLFVISFLFMLDRVNTTITVETPAYAGTLKEGIVGVPISINPIYATNLAEKDVIALMHAGLLQSNNKGGYETHLADTWQQEKNESSVTHTFTLKEATFHDGNSVTSEDVLFTVQTIQDPNFESPYRNFWKDVSVTTEGDAIIFTVPNSALDFPRPFTFPIMPKHLWSKVPPERARLHNDSTAFIGAGPFIFSEGTYTIDEKPITFSFTPFKSYVRNEPYLRKITQHFFETPAALLQAYKEGEIHSLNNISALEIPFVVEEKRDDAIYTTASYKLFGIFFNTEDGKVLFDSFLRSILTQQVDRERIIADIFNGYAHPVSGPFPLDRTIEEKTLSYEEILQTLEDIGWEFEAAQGVRAKGDTTLSLTVLVPEIEELQQVASVITKSWEKIGVEIQITEVPAAALEEAIATKEYDAFIYGYEVYSPKELRRIWHSSSDSSLAAVGSFGSTALNELLDEIVFSTKDDRTEKNIYNDIALEIAEEVPAIFLFSPHFIYVLPKQLLGVRETITSEHAIIEPSNRFYGIETWHIRTEEVWAFLTK